MCHTILMLHPTRSDLVSGIVEEDATVSQSDAFDGVSLSDLSLGMLSLYTVKPVLSGHSKRGPKLIFNTDDR